MRVNILSWTAIASWRWAILGDDDDVCGICRGDFDGTCPSCKFPGDECPLVAGQCKHIFHIHCLETWVKQQSSLGKCPMCRQQFVAKDVPPHPDQLPIPLHQPPSPVENNASVPEDATMADSPAIPGIVQDPMQVNNQNNTTTQQ